MVRMRSASFLRRAFRSWRLGMPCLMHALLALTVIMGGLDVAAAQSDNHASLKAYPEAVLSATDAQSGIKVAVEPDGTSLTATDKSGRVIWKADVVKEVGAPPVGEPVVRHVSIKGQTVTLVLGKHRVAEATLETGKVRLVGDN